MYDKKFLGLSSPQALLNTVWVNNMIHFGLQGCKEQKEIVGEASFLKLTAMENNISSIMNAKRRREQGKIQGINVLSATN